MSDKLLTWEKAVQWLTEQSDQQELVKHCYYDDPLLAVAERFSDSEEWQAIRLLLKKHIPGRILDLGAGRGISSYAFAKAGCNVTALEPDPSSLVGAGAIRALFKESGLPIQIVQEYGESLPFQDETFDVVYGRAVLHHAHDLSRLCKETRRVLKQGGILIATREHVISKKEDLQAFLDSHPLHFLYGGENAYLLQEYTQAIKQAGLQLQQVIAPMESVINYAPMTQDSFSAMVASKLQRCFGQPLAQWLSTNKVVQQLYGRYVSKKYDAPGRHYSFIAVKK